MIKISKEEALWLNKCGINFGENGISHTWNSKHKTYYLSETADNKKLHKEYEESRRN